MVNMNRLGLLGNLQVADHPDWDSQIGARLLPGECLVYAR